MHQSTYRCRINDKECGRDFGRKRKINLSFYLRHKCSRRVDRKSRLEIWKHCVNKIGCKKRLTALLGMTPVQQDCHFSFPCIIQVCQINQLLQKLLWSKFVVSKRPTEMPHCAPTFGFNYWLKVHKTRCDKEHVTIKVNYKTRWETTLYSPCFPFHYWETPCWPPNSETI